MDALINDVMATAKDWFLGGDVQFLAVILVAALISALMMRGAGQLLGASVFALILMAVGLVVVNTAQGESANDPQAYLSGLNSSLTAMMDGAGSGIITPTAIFAILIVLLLIVKGFFFRGE